jgi:hypothetical protein
MGVIMQYCLMANGVQGCILGGGGVMFLDWQEIRFTREEEGSRRRKI